MLDVSIEHMVCTYILQKLCVLLIFTFMTHMGILIQF